METILLWNFRHNFGFFSLLISVKISVYPFHHVIDYLQCQPLKTQENWKPVLL